jgi:coenzyme PQQ synthesis protein D (PqqD)
MSATANKNGSRGLLSERALVPQHVVYRAFAHETVVLNLQTGKYHGLNPTAARFLEALEREPTIRDAAQRLAEEYARPPDEMEIDICAFCSDLLQRGLIELRSNGHS